MTYDDTDETPPPPQPPFVEVEAILTNAILRLGEPDLITEAASLCDRLFTAMTAAREQRVDRILKRAEARLQRREFAELNQACRPMTTDCTYCDYIGPCFFDGQHYICIDRVACKARITCDFCGDPAHLGVCAELTAFCEAMKARIYTRLCPTCGAEMERAGKFAWICPSQRTEAAGISLELRLTIREMAGQRVDGVPF